MRFNLVDLITEVEPGRRLEAIKNLTLGEEYLADHFPTFPVMPGVLMLQTLVEAGAWLLRISEDFQHSMIVLREAKNIKYGHFVDPGRQMVVTVEMLERTGNLASFKGRGEIEGNQSVSARIMLVTYNLRDHEPSLEPTDAKLVAHWRELHRLLARGSQPVAQSPVH
jgi:3-hydroxyacyl-[acyl-carrier-protein] dehydratase